MFSRKHVYPVVCQSNVFIRSHAASIAMIFVTEVKHNCDIFMCVDVSVVGHYSIANSFAFEMKHKIFCIAVRPTRYSPPPCP